MSEYPAVPGPDAAEDPTLHLLLEQLKARYHNSIYAMLVYGSCLRTGDIYEGLLDLYLICSSYRAAYRRPRLAAANWLLPPNVFYAEVKHNGKTLRGKVTMISLHDFQRGCSRAWFQSYIWGRFSQPTRILYSRDQQTRELVEHSLLRAARTLLQNSLPALPAKGTVTGLWEQALKLVEQYYFKAAVAPAGLPTTSKERYAAVGQKASDLVLQYLQTVIDDTSTLGVDRYLWGQTLQAAKVR